MELQGEQFPVHAVGIGSEARRDGEPADRQISEVTEGDGRRIVDQAMNAINEYDSGYEDHNKQGDQQKHVHDRYYSAENIMPTLA